MRFLLRLVATAAALWVAVPLSALAYSADCAQSTSLLRLGHVDFDGGATLFFFGGELHVEGGERLLDVGKDGAELGLAGDDLLLDLFGMFADQSGVEAKCFQTPAHESPRD